MYWPPSPMAEGLKFQACQVSGSRLITMDIPTEREGRELRENEARSVGQ